MSFELKTDYPLTPEVDETHNVSKGLRRHFPQCFDSRGGNQRDVIIRAATVDVATPVPFWLCVPVGVVVWAIATVML